MESGDDVEDRDAGAVGGEIRIPGEAHHPGHRLDEQVVSGQGGTSGRAESGNRRIHDSGIAFRNGRIVQTEAVQSARLEVLDDDVGTLGNTAGRLEIVRVAEVQRDRPLVPVDRQVVRGLTVEDRRFPRTGFITGRALHLDDGGAHVCQKHGAVGPGQDPAEVGDNDSGQRTACVAAEGILVRSSRLPIVGRLRGEGGGSALQCHESSSVGEIPSTIPPPLRRVQYLLMALLFHLMK